MLNISQINLNFKGRKEKQEGVVCPDVLMAKICPKPLYESFFTDERGKEAWAMNIGSIYSARYSYPCPDCASLEDKEILFSKKPETAKKWTHWINPKTGRTYIVINKKDNKDGTKTARILDCDGNFIKEADIKPKKIIQIDNFNGRTSLDYGGNIAFSHGEVVRCYLERNNPLADIESINIGDVSTKEIEDGPYVAAFEDILLRLMDGEKIDVINCSFGADFKPAQDEDAMFTSNGLKEVLNKEFSKDVANKIIPLLEEITKFGTRVVFAAGNEGKDYVSLEFGADGVDVVGAINDDGTVCDFSSARNFAKHYERGIYTYRAQKYGINATGKPGADFSYEGTAYEPFMGKKPEEFLVSKDELKEYKKLNDLRKSNKLGRFEYNTRASKYTEKLFRLEDCGKNFKGIELDPFNTYFYPKKSLLLTTDSNGFLVPVLLRRACNGTSMSAPVRSAKIALNETMQEILRQ